MKNFVDVAKSIVLEELPHDGMFVNYTMTGGRDTMYLAEYMSEGNVLAFATNDEQLDAVLSLCESNFQNNVLLVKDRPIEVEKYLTEKINGYIINTIKGDISDEDMVAVIDKSFGIMKRGAMGVIVMSGDNVLTTKYIESLSSHKVTVLKLAMPNDDVPIVYILEKLYD